METKIGKVETLFLMFCVVICIVLLPDIDLKHECVHDMFSSSYPMHVDFYSYVNCAHNMEILLC